MVHRLWHVGAHGRRHRHKGHFVDGLAQLRALGRRLCRVEAQPRRWSADGREIVQSLHRALDAKCCGFDCLLVSFAGVAGHPVMEGADWLKKKTTREREVGEIEEAKCRLPQKRGLCVCLPALPRSIHRARLATSSIATTAGNHCLQICIVRTTRRTHILWP